MSFLFFVLQLQIIILLISKFSCTEDLLTDVDVRVLESRPIKRVSIPGRVKTKIIKFAGACFHCGRSWVRPSVG
jgi:hypothetical protein